MLAKYAVMTCGGKNYCFGTYDGVMIMDNHISSFGCITEAVQMVREQTGHMVNIEVETETKEQVLEAAAAGADIIMFDNCNPDQVREFSSYVPSSIVTEASGGITLETLKGYCGTNVDYISLGFITHSAKALDISFEVSEEGK